MRDQQPVKTLKFQKNRKGSVRRHRTQQLCATAGRERKYRLRGEHPEMPSRARWVLVFYRRGWGDSEA